MEGIVIWDGRASFAAYGSRQLAFYMAVFGDDDALADLAEEAFTETDGKAGNFLHKLPFFAHICT